MITKQYKNPNDENLVKGKMAAFSPSTKIISIFFVFENEDLRFRDYIVHTENFIPCKHSEIVLIRCLEYYAEALVISSSN